MDMTGHPRDKIVPISGYRRDMRFPCISEVQAYWEALRDGRQVPCRSEVDPRGIERALEYTFVLERIAPGVARFVLQAMPGAWAAGDRRKMPIMPLSGRLLKRKDYLIRI